MYAIPDAAVPAPGREVQCAACAYAWYQLAAPPGSSRPDGTPDQEPASGMAEGSAAAPAGPGEKDDAGGLDRLRSAMGEAARKTSPVIEPSSGAAPPAAATDHPGQAVKADPPVLSSAPNQDAPQAGAAAPAKGGPAARSPAASAEEEPADDADDTGAPAPPSPDSPPRRVDPDVLRILREEAAIETEARTSGRSATASPSGPTGSNYPTTARDRLARLKAAERSSATLGPADSEAAVEDAGAAQRRTPPPLLSDPGPSLRPAAPATEPAPSDPTDEPEAAAQVRPVPLRPAAERPAPPRNLPVKLSERQRALVIAQQRRRGFRLGFGTTAGLCCAAVLLYLAAPLLARWLPAGTPFAEAVIDHGDHVQATLVEMFRAVFSGAS
ncbi:MAG: hypothetical protein KDA73_03220 [Rhodobacteraceae bacterium]|nr:hypothetical protein [Paracoccaceae bacterium]